MSEWQKVQISDVCTINKGTTGIQKAVAGEYPMVTLAEERTTHNEFQFDCEAVIIQLVSSTGHGHASMKRVHYQEGKFALGSILCAVVPNDPNFLNPKYLHIYLSYLKDKLLVSLMRGAANVSLSISNIKTVEVIVPPIERQLEIIELEKVLRIQKGKLNKQNTFQKSHLTLLRQQILQDAISGKLTVDWRAENPDTEPASKLLEQIKAEKGKLIAEKKIKKEKPLPKITREEVPFGLPEGWEWCRLGEITEKTGSGSTPRGGKSAYIEDGIKFIRSQNVYNSGLVLEDITCISGKIHEKMRNTKVSSNDLLLNITGGSIGRCAIVPLDFDEGNVNQHVSVIRFVDTSFSDFLHKVIISNYFQKEIINSQTGAGREGLPKYRMDRILIPLPPRAEQRAIVAKVERLMGYVSQLEEKITQNANNAQTLMQAFLGEVFRK